MCGLESERGKLKFDAPLNWQPVEFLKTRGEVTRFDRTYLSNCQCVSHNTANANRAMYSLIYVM